MKGGDTSGSHDHERAETGGAVAGWPVLREAGGEGQPAAVYYYEYVEPPRAEGEPAPPPWWRSHPWLGMQFGMANQSHNCDLLIPYDGQHVAWYPDGSGIRDADEDFAVLWDRIKASGDDPQWYTYEFYSSEPHL